MLISQKLDCRTAIGASIAFSFWNTGWDWESLYWFSI